MCTFYQPSQSCVNWNHCKIVFIVTFVCFAPSHRCQGGKRITLKMQKNSIPGIQIRSATPGPSAEKKIMSESSYSLVRYVSYSCSYNKLLPHLRFDLAHTLSLVTHWLPGALYKCCSIVPENSLQECWGYTDMRSPYGRCSGMKICLSNRHPVLPYPEWFPKPPRDATLNLGTRL